MSNLVIPRPAAGEHAPYYGKYIAQVPDGDLISLLRDQAAETQALLRGLSGEKASYAYAPDKWTVKEVVGHLSDVERVMTYRALRFSRGDAKELAGFDEGPYVANANFGRRPLADLLDELDVVRASTIAFARGLAPEMLERRGIASNNPVTVRALLYIIAGHERHHIALLRDRYQVT